MSLIHSTIISKVSFQNLMVILGAFLLPIKPLLILVALFIGIDTITGIIASKREGKKITSRGLSAIISKFILYQASVLLIFALEKYLLCDFVLLFTAIPLFLTKIVATILVSIEVISVNENLERGWGINLWHKIKIVLARAKEVKATVDEVLEEAKDTKKKVDEIKKEA